MFFLAVGCEDPFLKTVKNKENQMVFTAATRTNVKTDRVYVRIATLLFINEGKRIESFLTHK